MKVVVALEHRFYRTPDGSIWTNGPNAYGFWTRYLTVFDQVKVVARVEELEARREGFRRSDGPHVVFHSVPNYLGPWQYSFRARAVHKAITRAVDSDDAIIMRVSSNIGGCLERLVCRAGRPYGLEVVNDPYEVFAPGAVQYHLRPFFRWWFTRALQRQCRAAAGVAYVTERALQSRYPCASYSVGMSDVEIPDDTILERPSFFTTHYSSVELSKEDSVPTARCARQQRRRFRLITLASLAQMYKAPDILIHAVADCVRSGFDLELNIAGEGKHRPELERLVAHLKLQDRVRFLGQIPAGAPVRALLDASDVFILPSRSEGLPRAMIEAMARSLPCIGSNVGGIPELLAAEDLVPPGDVQRLASKIREVLSSPERMTAMSARNLAKAQEYREDILAARRQAFFEHIRRSTAAWLEERDRVSMLSSIPLEGR